MQQKSDTNRNSAKLDLNNTDSVASKSLGELDSIILEKAFLGQDSIELAYSEIDSSFPLEKALYIVEIDDSFCFLDYTTEELNPQPISIKAGSLSNLPVANSIVAESDLDLAKIPKPSTKQSLFSGKKGILMGMGLGVLLTLGITRLFLTPTASNNDESESVLVKESVAPAQTVTVAEVETTDINSTLDTSGTVTAFERTPVMSQATGLRITDILAETGDYVDRGQILARLNNKILIAQKTEAQAAVAQQKAALDELQAGSRVEEVAQAEARVANAESATVQAESDLELIQKRVVRNRSLEQEGAITRDRFDEVLNQEKVAKSNLAGAKANLNEAKQALAQIQAGSRRQTIVQAEAALIQAQGRLQAIESQLDDTTIVAPSSGIIASREARVGQITSSSERLFSIIQNGRLELRLQVPETLVGKIKSGQKVAITSNANPELKLTGEVREIDPIVNDSSRQALVKVDLPSNSNLKPGMFLRAAINTNTNQGLAIPIEALLPQSGNNAIAFVLQPDNTVKAQTVSMGEIIDDRTIEIIGGLESGDRIVLKGAAYLKDGDVVEVSNE